MRCFTYTQQLEHLKMPLDKIVAMLEKKGIQYAYCIHDKDVNADGTKKAVHVHFTGKLNSANTFKTIAKWFKDEPQFIESGRNWNSCLLYLIHATKQSIKDNKYQYDVKEVKANFDYIDYIDNIKSKRTNNDIVGELLRKIANNEIPRTQLNNYVDDITRIDNWTKIQNAYKIRDEKIMNGGIDRNMQVMYIYGEQGVGKTTYAKEIAKQNNYDVFVSGSSNDILDGYNGQQCIILDDLRGSSMRLSDLLKFLDNNTSSLVKSRYNNKLIDAKMIIITSIYNLDDLYKNFNEQDEPIGQLKRRINLLTEIDKDYITTYPYDNTIDNYNFNYEFRVPNLITKKFKSDNERNMHILENLKSSLNKINDNLQVELTKALDKEMGLMINNENQDNGRKNIQ